jgi:3-methyladenine DNA glycosylase AlkD
VTVHVEARVAELEAALRALADPDRRAFMERTCPTAMEVIGVKVPAYRPLVKALGKRIRGEPVEEVTALALALVDTGTFEARSAAYEILEGNKKALRSLTPDQVLALGEGVDNWASVDTWAGYVVGPLWRDRLFPDATVQGWLGSADRWLRRTAVVCTVALNQKARGGKGDTPRTLQICAQVGDDRDDMVVKALSWSLRELAKRDPDAVEAFLAEHEVAPRVRREVRNKLDSGLKNPNKGSKA